MSTSHDLINRLPELPLEPFEVAGTLDRSDRGPFLTIRPHKSPAPDPPTAQPLAPSKSGFTVRKYFTQAVYRVICYYPDDLLVSPGMKVAPQPHPGRDCPPTDIVALAGQERFYKLTSLKSVPLHDPLWCSVKYGPWLAIAKETESCTAGVPPTWEFYIVEVPEVSLVWSGNWEDIPPYPSLQVVMGDLKLAAHEYQCCSGFQWCPTTQSCIPLSVPCQDPIP